MSELYAKFDLSLTDPFAYGGYSVFAYPNSKSYAFANVDGQPYFVHAYTFNTSYIGDDDYIGTVQGMVYIPSINGNPSSNTPITKNFGLNTQSLYYPLGYTPDPSFLPYDHDAPTNIAASMSSSVSNVSVGVGIEPTYSGEYQVIANNYDPSTDIKDFKAPFQSIPIVLSGYGTLTGSVTIPSYIWVDMGYTSEDPGASQGDNSHSPSNPSNLFTAGSEVVDFNELLLEQRTAIADGADLYHGLGGNDQVYLPNTGANSTAIGWQAGVTFIAGDTTGQSYTITGGDGSDKIQLGSGTDTVYGSPGNDAVTAGSGKTTFDYTSGRFANFAGISAADTAGQTINALAHAFQTTASAQDTLILPGSANDYGFRVTPSTTSTSAIGGQSWASTHTSVYTLQGIGLPSVHIDTQGVERVQFADPLSNTVTLTDNSLYAEAAQLAVEAYTDTTNAVSPPRNWHAVSAMELGIKPFSDPSDALQYSFTDGLYRASIPTVAGGEDDATVLSGVVDGKQTLAISFRGTDQILGSTSDVIDYFPFETAYAKLQPLVTALKPYIQSAGIEKVLIDGHSLGGALAQIFTNESLGVSDVDTFTFGSPGADVGNNASFTTNFIHTGDIVPTLGSAKAILPSAGFQGDYDVGGEVYVHSVVASPSVGDQHSIDIYNTDTVRIIQFANDPTSVLSGSQLGQAIKADIAYVGPTVQVMPGTSGDDRMYASSADNYVLGGAGNDTIILTPDNLLATGPDSLLGTTTNTQRMIDGGSGVDTLNVGGFSIMFKETPEGSAHYNLTTAVTGSEVADVTNVENLHFLDGTLSNSITSAAGEVYTLYQGLLGRVPDTAGLQSWVSALSGGTSLHDVTAAILNSAEAVSHINAADATTFVEQLYQSVLGRPGDAGGVAAWTAALNGGTSRADVADSLVFSAEHTADVQPALSAGVYVPDQHAVDVAQLYYGLLGRAADAGGLQSFTDAVESGSASLQRVAQSLLGSAEHASANGGVTDSTYVQDLYQQVLGRAADTGGLQSWTSALSGGTSRASVATAVLDSGEFQGAHANQSSSAYVEALYEHVLDRTGDAGGVQAWAGLLDSHADSRIDVANAFVNSAEFQAHLSQQAGGQSDSAFVQSVYENALGRAADAGGLQAYTSELAHGTSRADVAVSIAESAEAQQHLASQIQQSWHLA